MKTQSFTTTRRGILKLGLGTTAAVALTATGCSRFGGGGTTSGGGTGTINMIWWGDADRAASTEAMLDVYKLANEGVTIKTEYQDSGPYKDKMATRFAANDVPDLFNQRRDSLREYADRDALLNLAEHSDLLNLTDVPEDIAALGKVGDAIYGLPAGLNTVGFVVNEALAEKYGVEIPDGDQWSWDDYFAMTTAFTKASKGDVYGGDIDFGTLQSVVVFIRQTGEELYNEDGSLGVSEKTMTDWYTLSAEQRKTGGLPPAGFVEAGMSSEESYLAKGKMASQVIPTNNFKITNESVKRTLVLSRMPGETDRDRRGMSIDTAMYWSIGTKSKNIDGGLKLLDFITNNVEANNAVGATRGVPASSVVAEETRASLHADDQISVDYLKGLMGEELPASRPDPIGGSEVASISATLATEVMFERVSPADAAKEFVKQAKAALAKA